MRSTWTRSGCVAFNLAQAIKNNANGSMQSISMNNNYITKFGEVALTEAVELVRNEPGRDLSCSSDPAGAAGWWVDCA